MVSSDFGKLEVQRHLSSGIDCAIAGFGKLEAAAVATPAVAAAAARAVASGECERGIVLCGAYVTERLIDRTCYVDHGSRLDPIIPGWLDRGGAINCITPANTTSKNATGMAVSGFLCEVQKVTDEEMAGWRRDYPEAFERYVDPDAGVCLKGWLIDEEEKKNGYGLSYRRFKMLRLLQLPACLQG